LPETMDTAPVKSLAASASVMSLAPAVMPVVPATVNAPVCVIAPPVCNNKLPLTVDAPRDRALASKSVTLPPCVTDTVPVKSLAGLFRVMLFAVSVKRARLPPVRVTGLLIMISAASKLEMVFWLFSGRIRSPARFKPAEVLIVLTSPVNFSVAALSEVSRFNSNPPVSIRLFFMTRVAPVPVMLSR